MSIQLSAYPRYSRQDIEVLEKKVLSSDYLVVEKLKVRFKLFDREQGWSQPLWRERIVRESAAAVLLYHVASDQVVMIEQVRMGALETKGSPWLIEPVAGIIDKGETGEDTAHREAFEEAGCTIIKLIFIGTYIVSPGISTELTDVFCGLIDKLPADKSNHGLHQDGEDILVHVLPSDQAIALLRPDNPMSAAATILLQWLQLNRDKVRKNHL